MVTMRRFLEVSGFVLAGGASRRMGRPKQGLMLDGETMLERQCRLLSGVCCSVAVLGFRENPANHTFPAFEDTIPGHGPLGGIYTGLSVTRTEYNLFLGCDLPFMKAGFLRLLCRRAVETGAGVTVPICGRADYQPLCAVYRRRVRGIIRATLLRGENQTTAFYSGVRCEFIGLQDVARAGFGRWIFTNMNTPADYEAARRIVTRGG
jgi:molybdenum cofactor guanylyltransferase